MTLAARLSHVHLEFPLVLLVPERDVRNERRLQRLVDLRFEQRIEPRRLFVVPDQLRVTDGLLRWMAHEVAQTVVALHRDLRAIDGAAKTRRRAEDREAFVGRFRD